MDSVKKQTSLLNFFSKTPKNETVSNGDSSKLCPNEDTDTVTELEPVVPAPESTLPTNMAIQEQKQEKQGQEEEKDGSLSELALMLGMGLEEFTLAREGRVQGQIYRME